MAGRSGGLDKPGPASAGGVAGAGCTAGPAPPAAWAGWGGPARRLPVAPAGQILGSWNEVEGR